MRTWLRKATEMSIKVRLWPGAGSVEQLEQVVQRYRGPEGHLGLHRAQDLQSWLMHQAAVHLLGLDPRLVERLQVTLARWRGDKGRRSEPLLAAWGDILERHDWQTALAHTERAQELRQASPLATVLPQDTRLAIIEAVHALKGARRPRGERP